MKIAIVIPALKPGEELIRYTDELLHKSDAEVVVIDDGSGKEFLYTFGVLSVRDRCTVLRHEQNMGKGAALKTAIKYIKEKMTHIDGIVTADSDGQHSVEDVIRIIKKLSVNQDSLVLGVREFDETTPKRSLMGNRISAKTLRLLYGINLQDTQTGLRAISKKHFDWLLALKGDRYEYEMNMLIYSKNIALEISTITIKTLYFDNNSGSHFNTVKDGVKVYSRMLIGLLYYIRNSGISALVDISIFTVLFYVTQSILAATMATTIAALTARVISSIVDFRLNRNTFASKAVTGKRAYIKYYTLWAVQIAVSTILVNLINIYFGALQPVIKPVVDLSLAILSYKIQLHWVFKAKRETLSFNETVQDIIYTKEMQALHRIKQHTPDVDRYEHSVYVAYTAYNICLKLGLDATAAARGGLLHDFELVGKIKNQAGALKMFFCHAAIAEEHADETYSITSKERNIISSHMWPATPLALPLSAEAAVVGVADKYCAVVELLGLYKQDSKVYMPISDEKHAVA